MRVTVFHHYKLQFALLDARAIYIYTSGLEKQMSKYKGTGKR